MTARDNLPPLAPGWDPDPLYAEPQPDPEPPRRFGCLSFAVLFLVLVAGVPTSSSALELPPTVTVQSGVPVHRAVDGGSRESLPKASSAGTPQPSGAASSLYSASATWCAPTPTQCQGWGGNARLAAVNSFRFGDEPYPVRVWRDDIYVDVTVVSFCACRGTMHAIDLSPSAFKVLAPLSRGRIDVAVEVLVDLPPHKDDDRMRAEDGGPTLPPTDQ